MADIQLSTYQKNIIDTFKSTKDNLFIEALAGCVDCDTEYFNGTEWVRIADYKQGDKVLQYDIDTHEASLATPILYHKYPCEQLWHFETKYGLDQCLCDEHNLLYYSYPKSKKLQYIKCSDFIKKHNESKNGFLGQFETVFDYSGIGINLTDIEIRIMVAVIADGTFYYKSAEDWDSYYRCRFHIKKDRKKIRLRKLFEEANYQWIEKESAAIGYTDFYIDAPRREKVFTKDYWYNCNQHQLQIICDELSYWDGDSRYINNYSKKVFYTNIKETADFVQFVYSACGYRATIKPYNRIGQNHTCDNKLYEYKTIEYRVIATCRHRVGMTRRIELGKEKVNITPYQTKDGYKYCFSMPLGTLILRRNGKIFITGNCGKTFILVELSKLVNSYSVFVAFNKSIQEELKLKITNPKFKTYTFNGLGFMIMNYNWEIQEKEKKKKNPSYKTKSLVVDTYKINNIVSKYLKQENLHQILGAEEYLKVLEDTVHLYDLCRQRLVNMEDIDEISDVIDFYDLYDEYIPDDLVQILQYVTAEDIRQFKEDGVIDFIDQIFITYILIKQGVWELAYFHRFENIFVDECLPGDIYVTCLDDGTEKRIPLKTLYKRYCNNQSLPLAKSFNHATGMYEFKPILNVKKHENRKIYEITTEGLNKIRATDNHKFYTQRGYVEVKDLIIGKDILCLDKIENQKTKFLLNDDQLQVAWASSIGDGYLEKRSQFHTYRLSFTQGETQKEYLNFKVNLFHSSSPYRIKSGYCDNNVYQSKTNTFIMFEDLWQGIEQIDERFLAIWYQDDGSAFYTKTGLFIGCRISCNNLNAEKIQQLIDIIYKKFKISLDIMRDKTYFSVRMNKVNSIRFLKLIAPYMHPDLAYKNIYFDPNNRYEWNNQFKNYGGNFIKSIKECGCSDVYDIEVQDNHNFICSSNQYSTGIISHNCQDLSKLQQMFIGLLRRSKTSRYVFVGDKHQCQPAGTKILMRDGSEKNIEDVQIGESVAQYSTQHGLIVGVSEIQDFRKNYIVSDKKSFNVHDLVSVELDNGYKSQYTYNHIAYVRMNAETTKNAVCLYLMYKEDGNLFRIGKVKLYSKNSNTFCLRPRMLSEGFDKAWILNIYDSNKEAWINEQLYSLKYQIPQLIFQADKISYTLQDVKYIYDNIGGNLFERGISLLHEFNKEFEFPFFERGDTIKHIAKTHGFFLAACNIFPKYMEMGIYDEKNIRYHTYKNRNDTFRGRYLEYHTIQKRTFEHGDFKVYGLTVPYCNTYIADKIVTHNSIYSFAGADCHSTDTIKRLYKTKSLALPINYRCPSSHLDFVNEKYHIPIQPRPNAPEGEIYKIQYDEVCDYIKPGDCILSRKNKDLCKIALILLDNKFSIYIKDETLVTKLIKKISSFKDQVSTVNELNSVLQKITDEYYQQIEEQQDLLFEDDEEIVEDNTPHEEIVTYSDNSIDLLECVSILLNRYQEDNANNASRLQNIDSFIAYVKKKLCTKDTKDAIQCVSIHQAKGKEYNRVFILNNNKVFKELAHTSDQYEQEKNLVYIAMTRSKDTIFLVGTDPEEETHRYIEPNRLYNDEDDYNEDDDYSDDYNNYHSYKDYHDHDDELDLIAEQIFQEIDNLFNK